MLCAAGNVGWLVYGLGKCMFGKNIVNGGAEFVGSVTRVPGVVFGVVVASDNGHKGIFEVDFFNCVIQLIAVSVQ